MSSPLPIAASRPASSATVAAFAALAALAPLAVDAAVAAAPAARSASAAAHGAGPPAPHELQSIEIDDAWILEPPPGIRVAAAYFTMSNMGHRTAVLIGVACPLAASAMLHRTMLMQDESKMRPVERLAVAPSHVVSLAPDGLHVMLEGLRRPLGVGERVPLVLHFQGGGVVHITALVRPPGGG